MNFKFLLAVFVVAVALMPTAHSRCRSGTCPMTTTSPDCYQHTADGYHYTYFNWPANSKRLTFEARGTNDVHVLFSNCDGCNGFEIVIGGYGNQHSIIRENKQEGILLISGLWTETPNILSSTEMRKFWIDIMEEGDGVRIEVGQGTEVTGFMSRTWDYNPNELPTYVAFAAWKNFWKNIQVDYEFCLNQPDTDCQLENTYLKDNLGRPIEDGEVEDVQSWDECKQLCDSKAECQCFTWNYWPFVCYLMSNVPDEKHTGTSEGAISGIKRCWSPSSGGLGPNISCISGDLSNVITPRLTVAGNEEAYDCQQGCRDREGIRAEFFTLREGGGENNCYCLTNCDEQTAPNYYSSIVD